MLLCVNVSNSKITLGIFEQEKLKFKSHLSSVLTRTAEEYAILLHPFIAAFLFLNSPFKKQ